MAGTSLRELSPPGARHQPNRGASPSGTRLAGTPPRRRHTSRHADRRLALAIPAAALILALAIWPLIQLGVMSLHDVTLATLVREWEFVGLQKYAELLAQPSFLQIAGNTVVFVAVVTGLGIVGGFAVAVAVSSPTRGSSFLLGMMVFVWALPPVVNGSIWKFLLSGNGLINELLAGVGVPQQVGFLYELDLALWSVALVNAWAVIPFNALIFRAALLGIDEQLLDAAEVDGAGPWQRIRYVLIPHARPATTVLTVLTVVYAFRSFDFIYVMTAGGPGSASTTIPYYAYVEALVNKDLAGGAATAILSLAVVAVFALVYVRDLRRNEQEV